MQIIRHGYSIGIDTAKIKKTVLYFKGEVK